MAVLVAVFLLLQTESVQQAVVRVAMESLSDKVQADMRIGRVEYRFFNTLSLQDVYVEDRQGDTLLYVGRLDARFHFLRFFMGKIIFHSVEFDRLRADIRVDEDGVPNFMFLADAFADPHRKPSAKELEFRIRTFRLKDSGVRFTHNGNLSGHVPAPPGKIDFNRLCFDDIDAEIELDILGRDTLSARIVNLSGSERSGLRLQGLSTRVEASPARVEVPYLRVSLPGSVLDLADLALLRDSVAQGKPFENVSVQGRLKPSHAKLDDLGAFVPQLRGMKAVANVEAGLDGRLSSLRVKDIKVRYGDTFVLNGSLDLNGLPDWQQTFVYADLKEVRLNGSDTERFLSDLRGEPVNVPDWVKRLGTIRYGGNISGFFSNLVMYGRLATSAGSLSTDLSLQFENDFRDVRYNGTLKSRGLNLGRVVQSDKLGKLAFYFNTSGLKKQYGALQGTIDADVPHFSLLGYDYRDIRFRGRYDGNGFNGRLSVKDENVDVDFNGLIDLTQRLPVFDFALRVKETNLYALNLLKDYPDAKVSFNGRTNMTGNSLDNINGTVFFDSIVFNNAGEELNVDQIRFNSQTKENYTDFSIASRYLNGSISGNFKYTSLLQTAGWTLKKYMPALHVSKVPEKKFLNHVDIDLSISNTEDIARLFGSPHRLAETATIKGVVAESREMIDIVFSLPKIMSGTQTFENTTFHLWGEPKKLEFIVESNVPTQTDFWNLALYTSLSHDSLSANLEWRNRQQEVNRGDFRTLTRFRRGSDNKLEANSFILPSQIIISDSVWSVSADSIAIGDGRVCVENFLFGNGQQYLSVDGVASKDRQDSLKVEMKDVDLGFLSSLSGMQGFHVGGITTGSAILMGALERPIFDAILSVRDLKLNHKRVGDASVFSTWDADNRQVVAIASIADGQDISALAECSYVPERNTLDVVIDANRLSLDFLSAYYESVLPNTTGYASGKLHIGGPLDSIRFDGRLMVNEGQVTVGVLGSTFHFNDTIAMTPNAIEFDRITLYDDEQNPVTLDGELTHDGTFKNFKYNLTVNTRGARVANLAPGENDLFFGKAYADASVRITGVEEEVNIRVNALTRPGTKVFIQTEGSATTTDADGFIHFVKHEEQKADSLPPPREVTAKPPTNLKLNLQLEVTPAAEIELIVDPVGGDMISGKGSGNLRIEYDAFQADAKMYGSYTIESGKYLFTLQDVFRKEFRIESGSTVHWTGSPSDAQVNIKALYSLTASLKSLLDEDMLATFSNNTRMTVPVNCVLQLTGDLMTPDIQFAIDLPASDEGVKQVVRSVISTEEMLTRQVLYLLVFNQFYKTQTQDNVVGGGEIFSLAASTVSAQLNNLFSQFTRNNHFSFGVDMRRVDESNMEYQVDLLYQPNDRWIVNGNFGYRENNNNIDDYNQYITDVDIEYLLTESGKLRLKFYNHTIDRTVELREAKNTQGAGVVYKEDFDSVFDMFRYYWRALMNIGKKKNKENEEKD